MRAIHIAAICDLLLVEGTKALCASSALQRVCSRYHFEFAEGAAALRDDKHLKTRPFPLLNANYAITLCSAIRHNVHVRRAWTRLRFAVMACRAGFIFRRQVTVSAVVTIITCHNSCRGNVLLPRAFMKVFKFFLSISPDYCRKFWSMRIKLWGTVLARDFFNGT